MKRIQARDCNRMEVEDKEKGKTKKRKRTRSTRRGRIKKDLGKRPDGGHSLYEEEIGEDNRCGVDSRTTMDMCSMQNRNSQLRHNHVVPALTGRCICV